MSSSALGEFTLGEDELGHFPVLLHLDEGIGVNDDEILDIPLLSLAEGIGLSDIQARTITFLEEEGISIQDGIIIQTYAFGRLGKFELAKSKLGFSPIPLHLDEEMGVGEEQVRDIGFNRSENVPVRDVLSIKAISFGRLGEFELGKSALGFSPIELYLYESLSVLDESAQGLFAIPLHLTENLSVADAKVKNSNLDKTEDLSVRDNLSIREIAFGRLGEFELGKSILGYAPIELHLSEGLSVADAKVRDIGFNRSENVPVRDVLSIKAISFGRLGEFELGKSALGFFPIILDLEESLGLGEAQIRGIDMNRADVTDVRDVLSLTKIGVAALGTLVLGKGQLGYHYWTVELSEKIGISDVHEIPVLFLTEGIGIEDIKQFMVLFLDEGIGISDLHKLSPPTWSLNLTEGISIADLTTFNIPAWAGVNGTIVISVDITKEDFCNLLSETSNEILLDGEFVAGIIKVLQTTQNFSENLKLFAGEAVLFVCPTLEFDIGDMVLFDDHEYEVKDFITKFIGENKIYRKLALRRTDIAAMEIPDGLRHILTQPSGIQTDDLTATLYWGPLTQPHLDHYEVWVAHKASPSFPWLVDVSKSTHGSWTTGSKSEYWFKVRAVDIYGNKGEFSDDHLIDFYIPPDTPPTPPPTPPTMEEPHPPTIRVYDASDTIDRHADIWLQPNIQPTFAHFKLYVGTSDYPPLTSDYLFDLGSGEKLTYHSSGPGVKYFRITAVDIYGNESTAREATASFTL